MHIIIAGGGKTGRKLIELFRDHPSYKITVIDPDPKKCELISEMFPHVGIVLGKAIFPNSIKEAWSKKTGAFIAVTGEDQRNLLAAKAAKYLGIPKVISKVEDPEYLDLCKVIGVDDVIDPTNSISAQVVTRLFGVDVTELIHQLHLDIELRQVTTEERPEIIDRKPEELPSVVGKNYYPILIQRKGKYYIPSEIEKIQNYDQVIMWLRAKR